MLVKMENIIESVVDIVGKITSVLLLLMIFNVFFDVIMRYFFRNSSVGMQEMEWHLFSVIILFGVSVALKDEGHVRVDFLYEKYMSKKLSLGFNLLLKTFFYFVVTVFLATVAILHVRLGLTVPPACLLGLETLPGGSKSA